MKNLSAFILIALLIGAVTACKKDKGATSNTGGTPPPIVISKFEGKVNGVMKSTNMVVAGYNGTTFEVEAGNNAFQWGLYLDGNIVEGQTYPFDLFGNGTVYYGDVATQKTYLGVNGAMTIVRKDTVNHILQVTFQGTFVDFDEENNSLTVTDGVAQSTYTE